MKTVKRMHKQKGSALISILVLFALVFSTAFYISKDILTFKKEQVRYELLSSRDLLVEQLKQHLYNPIVIGISAVLQSKQSTALENQAFRRCLDSKYDEKAVATEKCASLLCSKNSTNPACASQGGATPFRRPFKGFAPIGRSGDLNVNKICDDTNLDSCDYMPITGVSEAFPVRYRADGTACVNATPGAECIFWLYAEYVCDNSVNNSGTPNMACSAANKNIFINVTLAHATAYPRPTDTAGVTLPATTPGSESVIDKNRLNTQDIRLTYIPISEVKDTFKYLCPGSSPPACSTAWEVANGVKAAGDVNEGCPCNSSKSVSCPTLATHFCGSPAALDPNNKCCPCTCPSGLVCGSVQAQNAHGCPCQIPACGSAEAAALPPSAKCIQNNAASCPAPATLICGTAAAMASPGCPCTNPTCDPTLLCTDSNYKAGCPCRVAPASACPAVPVNCDDATHIKGCPCNNVGVCTGPHLCNSPAALAEPSCDCNCPTNFVELSPESLAHPGCGSNRPGSCPGGLICGTALANLNPGCPCTSPTCNAVSVTCGGPGHVAGCNCTQGAACPAPLECGTAQALANPACPCTCNATMVCSSNAASQSSLAKGCGSSCPTNLVCGTSEANALRGCVCQCPGATPTCLRDASGNYTIRPVAGCPCVPPPPPPPPPPSGS